ncbi:hypothetical protein PR048_021769 [Dryococelus australis]|uniref:Uncharacterized protein n=1 Tax=Dryococelus australis TaxID=614101 RepID=A0ABQ9GZ67_9NEOP|nr:hypothetical protein PR048_021769 [Dryococelus australis]
MKMVMILAHGNAQVEQEFSINADCIIENMREQTLVARRTTYDAVSSFDGVANVPITKSLIHAACNVRTRFQEDKDDFAMRTKQVMKKEIKEDWQRKRWRN